MIHDITSCVGYFKDWEELAQRSKEWPTQGWHPIEVAPEYGAEKGIRVVFEFRGRTSTSNKEV